VQLVNVNCNWTKFDPDRYLLRAHNVFAEPLTSLGSLQHSPNLAGGEGTHFPLPKTPPMSAFSVNFWYFGPRFFCSSEWFFKKKPCSKVDYISQRS